MDWLTNPSTNKKDTMLTLATAATLVVLFKFIFSDMTILGVKMGQLDGGVIAAILAPTLGAYTARRYSDAKLAGKDNGDTNA